MAEHLRGVSIICTKDRLTTRRKNQQAYSKLGGLFPGWCYTYNG